MADGSPRARLTIERRLASPEGGYGLLEDPDGPTGHSWAVRIEGSDMGRQPRSLETVLSTLQMKELASVVAEFVKGKPLAWLLPKLPRP